MMHSYFSDDYAGLEVDDLKFYYGYEHTTNDGIDDEDDPNWDEEDDWCFVVFRGDEEIARYTSSEIDKEVAKRNFRQTEVTNYLLEGIAMMIRSGKLEIKV